MDKPHVHAELIKQWADGAAVEYYDERERRWRTHRAPKWFATIKYRIKPRTFEDGHWYPIKDQDGDCCLAWYDAEKERLYQYRSASGGLFETVPDRCQWIGESLGQIQFGG